MSGKRTKKNNNVKEMTQETINAILQLDTIWTKEDLQELSSSALDKILATERAKAEAISAANIALKASKGRKKNETQFTRTARTVQRFLEDTETVHHTIMKRLIDFPSMSGKEINETFDIKYGATCVHHARVLLNVLYNNNMLNQAVVNKLEDIMAETE